MNLSMMALNANRMEKLVASPTAAAGDTHKSKEVAPFLKNLRKMLDLESDEILRWTPNGRAFEIHDMEQMMDYVLPKYFKHRKYTSFQRQLNYFNFKKWTKSKAVVCTFSNEYFLRDQPDLAWRISRKKSAQLGGFKSHPSARKTGQVGPAMSMKRLEVASFGSFRKPEDMAIMVPRKSHRYYQQLHSHGYNPVYLSAGVHEMESLDWIDNFLPSLENHPSLHPLNTHHHAYLRGSHNVYSPLQPPSDYVSMATM
jgi:hypothetical protein